MLIRGDLFDVLPTLDAESIDACVTDPPYGIGFMGREWDTFKPGTGKHRQLMHPRERALGKIESDNPNLNGRWRSPALSPSQIDYDYSVAGLRGFQRYEYIRWGKSHLDVLELSGPWQGGFASIGVMLATALLIIGITVIGMADVHKPRLTYRFRGVTSELALILEQIPFSRESVMMPSAVGVTVVDSTVDPESPCTAVDVGQVGHREFRWREMMPPSSLFLRDQNSWRIWRLSLVLGFRQERCGDQQLDLGGVNEYRCSSRVFDVDQGRRVLRVGRKVEPQRFEMDPTTLRDHIRFVHSAINTELQQADANRAEREERNRSSKTDVDAVSRRILIAFGVALCGFLLCWWGGQNLDHDWRLFSAAQVGGWLLIGFGLLLWISL